MEDMFSAGIGLGRATRLAQDRAILKNLAEALCSPGITGLSE